MPTSFSSETSLEALSGFTHDMDYSFIDSRQHFWQYTPKEYDSIDGL